MGLRDTLKGLIKGAIGKPAASPAAAPPPAAAAPRPPAPKRAPAAPPADLGPWNEVGPSARISPGRSGTFKVEGQTIAVFRTAEGGLFAIDNTCVHEDGPLGEGNLEGNVVTCPYHDWRYDVSTGACLTEPSRCVASYAIKESGGRIWIGKRLTESSRDRGGQHDDGMKTIVNPA